MSKRALIVLNNFAGGGAQRSITKYIIELVRSGYEVTAITLEDKVEHTLPQGFKWLCLPKNKIRLPIVSHRRRVRQLRKLVDSEGGLDSFDLKISTMLIADRVVSSLKDADFIFRFASDHHSTLHRNNHTEFVQKIKLILFRKVYGQSKILCVSEGLIKGTKDLLKRNDDRIRAIYNPFEFEKIRDLAKEHDEDIPEGPYLVHVGRPARQKRHDILLKAFKESGVPHKLVLVGKPGERATTLVKELSLEDKVVFTGFKKNPYPLIANASAMVLSSDYEGLPGVVIESLICGTPVASTRCNYGPSEILTGPQSHFLVEPGDIAGLAHAIRSIVSAPPDLTKVDLGKFRAEGFVQRLEEFASMECQSRPTSR